MELGKTTAKFIVKRFTKNRLNNMKVVIATSLLLSGAIAFAPSVPSRRCVAAVSSPAQTTTLFGGGDDEEEGGLDLDLGEMFDMYV